MRKNDIWLKKFCEKNGVEVLSWFSDKDQTASVTIRRGEQEITRRVSAIGIENAINAISTTIYERIAIRELLPRIILYEMLHELKEG